MRLSRVVVFLFLMGFLASQALASCPFMLDLQISHMGNPSGHFWTDAGKEYGGWFWIVGRGNNLINASSNDFEAGADSGTQGGVPLGPRSWLVSSPDGSIRAAHFSWVSAGLDGCGDVNGNKVPDPGEVLAVLVVDERGEQYALASVGGNGQRGWDLSRINNGTASAYGHPTAGIPMTPVPKPRFGTARDAGGGNVSVEILTPGAREIRTYDDMGGSRNVVQGFHIIQGEVLLAEISGMGGRQTVTAAPGETLILRTIFGASGDKGFYVDGEARVPRVGEAPSEPEPERSDQGAGADRDVPAAEPAREAPVAVGVPVTGVPGGDAAAGEEGDQAKDTDEDEVLDDEDNCPRVANEDQSDMDMDGVGDICDTCPFDENADQKDEDGDGQGDVCDTCPRDPDNRDSDVDGICDSDDNCVDYENPGQEDGDGDGEGDACDATFDPYVVEISASKEGLPPGQELTASFSVRNRSGDKQKTSIQVVWQGADEKEVPWAEDPECLAKVPLELELGPGEEFSRECAWTVPADAVKGAGILRVDVKHMEKKDVLADAQARVTVR